MSARFQIGSTVKQIRKSYLQTSRRRPSWIGSFTDKIHLLPWVQARSGNSASYVTAVQDLTEHRRFRPDTSGASHEQSARCGADWQSAVSRIGNPRYSRLPIGATASDRFMAPIRVRFLEMFPMHRFLAGNPSAIINYFRSQRFSRECHRSFPSQGKGLD